MKPTWGGAVAACIVCGSGSVSAQTSALSSAPEDGAAVQTPGRISLVASEDWILGAVFVGSLVSIQIGGFDEVDYIVAPQTDGSATAPRTFGRTWGRGEVALGLSLGAFLTGKIVGSETAARVGIRSFETIALSGVTTGLLKIAFGRSRPDTGRDSDQFYPLEFSRSSRQSFPSGHTSVAFGLATAVSLELADEAPWVPFIAYPLAAWTGVSRVLDEEHWLTDVLAGAVVGIFSGRVINRLHRRPEIISAESTELPGLTPNLLVTSSGDQLILGLSLGFN